MPASRRSITPHAVGAFASVALIVAVVAAYAPGWNAPFVFDDVGSIVTNLSIRHLGTAWSPPADLTVSGRPLVNVSLALNYLCGGLSPVGYHAALRRAPDYAKAHENLGLALETTGDHAAALPHLARAAALRPDSADVQESLGVALARAGRADEAEVALKRAVTLSPRDPELRFNLGAMLMNTGQLKPAAAEFETTLQLKPSHAAARANLELIRDKVGGR